MTIWNKLKNLLIEVTPQAVYMIDLNELQSIGISYRKAEYMKGFSKKVISGELKLEELLHKSDDEVVKILTSIKGIGKWTAEMLMLFSMQRKAILSFDDLAIIRRTRMLYHHKEITPTLFEKYRKRYSPYGSIASLYLWAVATGKIAGMKDDSSRPERKTAKKDKNKVDLSILKEYTQDQLLTENVAKDIKTIFDQLYFETCNITLALKPVGFSYHRSNQIFKETYHKTINDYVTEIKLIKAKHLLRNTKFQTT